MINLKTSDSNYTLEIQLCNEDGNVNLTNVKNVIFLLGNELIPVDVINHEKGIIHVYLNHFHTNKKGLFLSEVKVTFNNGGVETFPNDDYIKINIMNSVKELFNR